MVSFKFLLFKQKLIAMLSHLVYISTRKNNCTDRDIERILEASRQNNAEKNITGALLYSETQFVQYLEGEYNDIVALYDHIKKDDRHHKAALISSCVIAERSFPSWQMGAKKLSSIDYQTDMTTDDRKVFEAVLAGKEQESSKAIALINKLFR